MIQHRFLDSFHEATVCIFYWSILILSGNLWNPSASAQSEDWIKHENRLIAGLRERRLFDLAIGHSDRLLLRSDLDQTQTVSLIIEKMKTQASRASVADASVRRDRWAEAQQTADEFLQRYSDNPRALLVKVQAALGHLIEGELLQQELEAEMISPAEAPAQKERALGVLRQASSRLSDIEREIQRLIPIQRNRTLGTHELTSEELMKLLIQIRLQIAISSASRAKLYPPDDRLNRVDALISVLDRLKEIQQQTAPHQPVWWESQSLQVETLRLLQRYEDAKQVLAWVEEVLQSEEEEYSNPIPSKWIEQALLLAVELEDEDQIIELLRQAESISDRKAGLELARLQAAKNFSARKTGPEKTEWLNRATSLARFIQAKFGSYWGRRAQLILIGDLASNQATDDPASPSTDSGIRFQSQPDREAGAAELDLLIGLAEQAERRENFEDAVRAYDRAVELALRIDGDEEAFSLAVRAAMVFEKIQQHPSAAARLIELATEKPEHPSASAVHLRGCWNWSRGLEASLGDPTTEEQAAVMRRRQEYIDLLQKHIQTWPESNTSNQARMWLANEYRRLAAERSQGQAVRTDSEVVEGPDSEDLVSRTVPSLWQSAFENYSAVSPADPSFAAAMQQIVVAGQRWYDTTQPEAQRQVGLRIVKRLTDIHEIAESIESQIIAVTTLAELGVVLGATEPLEHRTRLNRLISQSTDPSVDDLWQNRLRTWRLVAAAFDPQEVSMFKELLEQIDHDHRWLALAERGIAAAATHFPSLSTQASQRLRKDLIERVLSQHQTQLEPAELQAWRFRLADVLADVGQETAALKLLEDLEKERPTDAGIKLRIARLLVRTKGDQDPAVPLAKWRHLSAQLKPHSDGWYEARYNTALMLEKMGQPEDARKLLQYLQAIPPGWENSRLKKDFEELLKRL